VVRSGQELAAIETTDITLALLQARAEREQAAAELRLRRAGSRKEDIAELEDQIKGVEADLAGAQRDLERMQALLDRGSGTTKARDDASTRRDVLAARLAQLEQQVQDARVKSPLDGVVTEKIAEAGEILQAGSPLVVVTDLKSPWLTVYVAGPDLGRIRLGQDAEVVTDDGQTRSGTLTFIASQAEFTPKNVQTRDERVKLVYKVKIGLDNGDGLFKPGMPAEARLRADAGAK
jgi:HlyD family secretion protein